MIRPLARSFAILVAVLALHQPASAQSRPADLPLETFVEQVARMWAGANVSALVDLVPEGERLILDAGSGTQSANSRHAAAALRALFGQHETMAAEAVRVTVSSERPPRGFGEILWTFRTRGAPGEQSRSIYVAALQRDGSWQITELRLMP